MRLSKIFTIAVALLSPSMEAFATGGTRDDSLAALRALSDRSAEVRQRGLQEIGERLRTEESIRRRSDVQRALAAFLRSEQQRIMDVVTAHGSAEDYQHFEAYQTELLPSVLAVLPNATGEAESELVTALVNGFFNPGSRVARAIAAVGEGAVPALLRATTSASATDRSKSFDSIGEMLGYHRAGTLRRPLSAASEERVRHALVAGLDDLDIVCRRNAIRGVIKARERTAIRALQVMAETDPDDGSTGLARNSVRALAARAIATLATQP